MEKSLPSIEWEVIPQENHAGYLYRTKVPGGWLVKYSDDVGRKIREDIPPQEGYEWRHSICFIPDPLYEWLNDFEKVQ